MFDDSRRLDNLEARLDALQKAHHATVTIVDSNSTVNAKNFEMLKTRLDDVNKWEGEANKSFDVAAENFKYGFKQLEELAKQVSDADAATRKMLQRIASLEATVAKLKK